MRHKSLIYITLFSLVIPSLSYAIINENFESGKIDSNVWVLFGSPQPKVVEFGRSGSGYALDPNSDTSWHSGIYSREKFQLSDGFIMRFWMKGTSSNRTTHMRIAGGISDNIKTEQGHTNLIAGVILDSPNVPTAGYSYFVGAEVFKEPYVNDTYHRIEMKVRPDGTVSFFRDKVLKFTSKTKINFAQYNNQRVQFFGNYYGMYFDDIVVGSFADNRSKLGVFTPTKLKWKLDTNENAVWDNCSIDQCAELGIGNPVQFMRPVWGDWNGDGRTEIGLFHNYDDDTPKRWYLDNNGNDKWDGEAVDILARFGNTEGLIPVVGDWNGDGRDKIGTFNPSDGMWRLDMNGNFKWDGKYVDALLGPFGESGDTPIVGDWNGDDKDEIGIYRRGSSSGIFRLDKNGNGMWDGNTIDSRYTFEINGDWPVIGDWDGNGVDDIGVYLYGEPSQLYPKGSGWFYLDLNGNRTWDGSDEDIVIGPFGVKYDYPIAGNW